METAPYWACARLEFGHERLGLDSLTRGGFEPYYPRIREHRRLRTGRKVVVTPALFNGYVFIVVQAQWYAARWAPGIIGLVMDGVVPGRVPDWVIDDLRSRERDGCVMLDEEPRLRPDDPIRVTSGLFSGAMGLFVGMRPQQRVEVLLTFLGSQRSAVLQASAVERVGG
jgi:transcription antitermination factor NusG